MADKLNRREFVKATAAAAGLAATLGTAREAPAAEPGPAAPAIRGSRAKPVVVSSANGHKYTNGGGKTRVQTAFAPMTAGSGVLEAPT